MSDNAPSASEQLAFLGNIEKLLLEGHFVASYKYALLVALADLAVRLGADDGSELDVHIDLIAERYIELYWRQCAPYGRGVREGESGLLKQNSGYQAAIINIIEQLRTRQVSVADARASADWPVAVKSVARVVRDMPLWRLQRLRSGELEFLYGREIHRNCVRLKPGVAANLRRFHGFIVRMAESEWLRFIQSLPANAHVLGPATDLEQFLFGSDRGRLTAMVEPLRDVQRGTCLYCKKTVVAADVDHFIPWSRYPSDLAHNLVLAHPTCNRKKKDLLACESHLEHWLIRNADQSAAITEAGRQAGLIVDPERTRRIAAWAYSSGTRAGAAGWIEEDRVEIIGERWRCLLPIG